MPLDVFVTQDTMNGICLWLGSEAPVWSGKCDEWWSPPGKDCHLAEEVLLDTIEMKTLDTSKLLAAYHKCDVVTSGRLVLSVGKK